MTKIPKVLFYQFETGVRSGRIRSGVRNFSTFLLFDLVHGSLFDFDQALFSL